MAVAVVEQKVQAEARLRLAQDMELPMQEGQEEAQ
jgi:hypothetical protein